MFFFFFFPWESYDCKVVVWITVLVTFESCLLLFELITGVC